MVRGVAGRRGLGAIVAALLAAFLLVGLVPPADAQTRARNTMLALTNEDRADREVAGLELNIRLSRVAKQHSREMANAGSIYHSSNLTGALAPYDWSIGGENVGSGGSLESLETAFMASTAHRRNILRKSFDHVGIGVVKRDGTYWVTLIFYG
ncbi:MAG: CAP domain-containing protein [Actinomycetota bacterium]